MGLKLLADCNTRNQSGSSTTAHLSIPSLKPGAAACLLNTLRYCFTSQLNWVSILLSHLSMPVLCFLLSRVIGFFFPGHTSSSSIPDNRNSFPSQGQTVFVLLNGVLPCFLTSISHSCNMYQVCLFLHLLIQNCVMHWVGVLSAPNTVIICYTWYCLSGIQHIAPSKGPTCLNWLTCTQRWTAYLLEGFAFIYVSYNTTFQEPLCLCMWL